MLCHSAIAARSALRTYRFAHLCDIIRATSMRRFSSRSPDDKPSLAPRPKVGSLACVRAWIDDGLLDGLDTSCPPSTLSGSAQSIRRIPPRLGGAAQGSILKASPVIVRTT